MILAIDASTGGCSVALFENRLTTVSINLQVANSSVENLTLMIDKVMQLAKVEYADLKAIAVAKGPGSYTGLRIAVSTAKGLAFGLQIPLISFSTLQAMAYRILNRSGLDLVCPMLDARRMEVYCGFYDVHTRKEIFPVEAVQVTEHSFQEILDHHRVLFIGEGSVKCKEVIQHPNSFFLEEAILPEAQSACLMVSGKFEEKEFEDLVTFEPYYLKEYMFKVKQVKGS